MKKISAPRSLRFLVMWMGAFALAAGMHLETEYREAINNLPQLVDEHGHTASVQTAMAALDSFEQIESRRKMGFGFFGVGTIFTFGFIATSDRKNQSSLSNRNPQP